MVPKVLLPLDFQHVPGAQGGLEVHLHHGVQQVPQVLVHQGTLLAQHLPSRLVHLVAPEDLEHRVVHHFQAVLVCLVILVVLVGRVDLDLHDHEIQNVIITADTQWPQLLSI